MLVVAASEAEIAAVLAGREAEVSLAGVNAARQVTVSGARGAITAIAAACAARGWRSQLLPVSQAFHSPLMEPMAAAFELRAGELAYAAARVPVISNLTGAPVERVNAGYWRAHMRQAVRFSQGLETLLGLGCDVLLEVGPRPVLLQLARQAAGGQGGRRYLTSLKVRALTTGMRSAWRCRSSMRRGPRSIGRGGTGIIGGGRWMRRSIHLSVAATG